MQVFLRKYLYRYYRQKHHHKVVRYFRVVFFLKDPLSMVTKEIRSYSDYICVLVLLVVFPLSVLVPYLCFIIFYLLFHLLINYFYV